MMFMSSVQTLCVLGVLSVSILTLEARSVDDGNQKLASLLNILQQRILKTLHKQHYPNNQHGEEMELTSDKHILRHTGSSTKLRAKRIGIAGHENIDLIINALNKGTGQGSPRLSMTGTLGKLRRMMANAGR